MSMSNPKILIIDDDQDLVQSVSEALDFTGYQIAVAYNGVEGIEQARLEKPAVIILDIMMPLMDGYQTCQILKSDPDTRDIPILMLTSKGQTGDRIQGFEAGVDQYLAKPFDVAELKARITSLVKSRRIQQAPAPARTKKSIMYITLDKNCDFQVELRGAETFVGAGGHCDIDLEQIRRRSTNLGQYLVGTEQWRFEAKSLGQFLYERLFKASPTLIGRYSAAQARGQPKDLRIYFRGSREFIGLPFELLFDGREYIALRHPLARTVSDITLAGAQAMQPFSAHLDTLASKPERLRILLVEANTIPPLEHAQREIEELTALFQQELRRPLVEKEVTVVHSQEATYEEVARLIEVGQFDIVHYAGHGLARDDTPEQNALVLWKGEGSRKLMPMPAFALVDILRDSSVQFFYLSSCLGAVTGAHWQLWDNDFLGLMDGVIQTGVPSVLGFRWAVNDTGARLFAGAFYRSLFGEANGVLEDAVFRARREQARAARDDPTWLSPVLVTQIQG